MADTQFEDALSALLEAAREQRGLKLNNGLHGRRLCNIPAKAGMCFSWAMLSAPEGADRHPASVEGSATGPAMADAD